MQNENAGKTVEQLQFDVKHLMNHEWLPSDIEKLCMTPESISESIRVYEDGEKQVLYSNLHIEYDSCDCGGGYPCSHGSWPYRITNGNKEQDIWFEDEGINIEVGNRNVTISDLNITMSDFEQLCKIAGFELITKSL